MKRVLGAAILVMGISAGALVVAIRAGENLAGRLWAVVFIVALVTTVFSTQR